MQANCTEAKTTHELAIILMRGAEYAEDSHRELWAAWQDRTAGRCWHKLAIGLSRLAQRLLGVADGPVRWIVSGDYDLCDTDVGEAAASQLEAIAASICLLDDSGVNVRQSAKAAASLRRTANAVRRAI